MLVPEVYGRSLEESCAAERAAAIAAQHRRALHLARASSSTGRLTMQERVDIAEALARDASAGVSASLSALRQVDERQVTSFARGYMNVLKECLDEFLAGYKEAKHAEVRNWLAANPAAFQQLAERVQATGGQLPYELLPPPPTDSTGGATLRVGNSTLQLSADTLASGGSIAQRAADSVLQRGARLLDTVGTAAAVGGGGGSAPEHSSAVASAASKGAAALRTAASTVRNVDTGAAASSAAAAAGAAAGAVQQARAVVRRDGMLGAAQAVQRSAASSERAQAARAEAAAVYTELRAALVGGQQAALSARAEAAAAAAAAAAKKAQQATSKGTGWLQQWLSTADEHSGANSSNGRLVGVRGTEALGEQPVAQPTVGGTGDPLEWAVGAVGSGSQAVRRAVRARLEKEKARAAEEQQSK